MSKQSTTSCRRVTTFRERLHLSKNNLNVQRSSGLELTQMDSLTRAEKEVLEKYNAQNEDKKPVSNQKVLAETMKKA